MLTAGSVCIDAEIKDMLNPASGNGIDSGAGVLWYGEMSWAKSGQILWLYRVISMLNAMSTAWIITSFHSCRILDIATFQHDNARPHTAPVTANFLAQNNVNVLPWPALSLDINPIKHIWDELGRRARTNHQINNVQNLTRALQREWQALPNVLIRRYINSMRRRIRACIASNGGNTRYWQIAARKSIIY